MATSATRALARQRAAVKPGCGRARRAQERVATHSCATRCCGSQASATRSSGRSHAESLDDELASGHATPSSICVSAAQSAAFPYDFRRPRRVQRLGDDLPVAARRAGQHHQEADGGRGARLRPDDPADARLPLAPPCGLHVDGGARRRDHVGVGPGAVREFPAAVPRGLLLHRVHLVQGPQGGDAPRLHVVERQPRVHLLRRRDDGVREARSPAWRRGQGVGAVPARRDLGHRPRAAAAAAGVGGVGVAAAAAAVADLAAAAGAAAPRGVAPSTRGRRLRPGVRRRGLRDQRRRRRRLLPGDGRPGGGDGAADGEGRLLVPVHVGAGRRRPRRAGAGEPEADDRDVRRHPLVQHAALLVRSRRRRGPPASGARRARSPRSPRRRAPAPPPRAPGTSTRRSARGSTP